MSVRKSFFKGWQRLDFVVYQFQVTIDAVPTDVHNGLSCLYTKKMPHVTATVTKMSFLCRNSQVITIITQ